MQTEPTHKKTELLYDWYIQIIIFLSFIANVAIWILIYRRIEPSRDLIALHYNIYFGISLLGEWYRVLVIPAFGVFVGFVNFALSFFVYPKDRVLAYIVMTSTFLVQLMLLFSVHLLTTYIL